MLLNLPRLLKLLRLAQIPMILKLLDPFRLILLPKLSRLTRPNR